MPQIDFTKYANIVKVPSLNPPQHAAPPELFKSRAVMLKDFKLAQDFEIDYRVENLFPKIGVALISGKSESAKSMLMSDLLTSISLGEKWLGRFSTKKARVVHINQDSLVASAVHKRYRRLWQGRGLEGMPEDIAVIQQLGLTLDHPLFVRTLAEELRENGFSVAVLDSLSDFLGGLDVNDEKDMNVAMQTLKSVAAKTSSLIILIDHDGKHTQSGGDGKTKNKGSARKVEAAEAMITSTRLRPNDDVFRLDHSKIKDGKRFENFQVELFDTPNDGLKFESPKNSARSKATKRSMDEIVNSAFSIGLPVARNREREFARENGVSARSMRAALVREGEQITGGVMSPGGGRPPKIWTRKEKK